jgi:hypothetical protein
MTVHVAEPANVHVDVEAQRGAGMEGAQRFVVAAAMLKANFDDLRNARGRKLNHVATWRYGWSLAQ